MVLHDVVQSGMGLRGSWSEIVDAGIVILQMGVGVRRNLYRGMAQPAADFVMEEVSDSSKLVEHQTTWSHCLDNMGETRKD